MSPEQAASASLISRLLRELRADRRAMLRHEQDAVELGRLLASPGPPDRAQLAWAATVLHAWYTALESTLERVARHLDECVPSGERWHQELLSQAMAAIPGLREPLLPEATETDLLELLGFRHFFRHAYAVELRVDRLAPLLTTLLRVAPQVATSLDRFAATLERGQVLLAGE